MPAARTAPVLPGASPRPGLPGAAVPAEGGVSLPKATVQLAPPTAPLGATAPYQSVNSLSGDEEEEKTESGLAGILSIVGFIAALVVLYFQLNLANNWINADDNPAKGQWSQLF
jgi:hypothetical protein